MSKSDLVECADCGWSGHPVDLMSDVDGSVCPSCGEPFTVGT